MTRSPQGALSETPESGQPAVRSESAIIPLLSNKTAARAARNLNAACAASDIVALAQQTMCRGRTHLRLPRALPLLLVLGCTLCLLLLAVLLGCLACYLRSGELCSQGLQRRADSRPSHLRLLRSSHRLRLDAVRCLLLPLALLLLSSQRRLRGFVALEPPRPPVVTEALELLLALLLMQFLLKPLSFIMLPTILVTPVGEEQR